MFGGPIALASAQRALDELVAQMGTSFFEGLPLAEQQAAAEQLIGTLLPNLLDAQVQMGLIGDDQESIYAAATGYLDEILARLPFLAGEVDPYLGRLHQTNSAYEQQVALLDDVLGRAQQLAATNPVAGIILGPAATGHTNVTGGRQVDSASSLAELLGVPAGDTAHSMAQAAASTHEALGGGSTLDA